MHEAIACLDGFIEQEVERGIPLCNIYVGKIFRAQLCCFMIYDYPIDTLFALTDVERWQVDSHKEVVSVSW